MSNSLVSHLPIFFYELKLEVAILLYQQGKISRGKVRAWTEITVLEFQHELAKRGLHINYDVEDFQSDIRID